MNSSIAFEVTAEDVAAVLGKHGHGIDSTKADELFVRHIAPHAGPGGRIERAALCGDDIDEQTLYAREEIESILLETCVPPAFHVMNSMTRHGRTRTATFISAAMFAARTVAVFADAGLATPAAPNSQASTGSVLESAAGAGLGRFSTCTIQVSKFEDLLHYKRPFLVLPVGVTVVRVTDSEWELLANGYPKSALQNADCANAITFTAAQPEKRTEVADTATHSSPGSSFVTDVTMNWPSCVTVLEYKGPFLSLPGSTIVVRLSETEWQKLVDGYPKGSLRNADCKSEIIFAAAKRDPSKP